MIQSILFFILGFLCAGFLALMIAPAVWRRAVTMTRKRIEASVPLTLPEIQADKDRMRAEFAMSTRRLEMSFKAFRDKANAQIIEINRNREELKSLTRERDGKNDALTAMETKAAELRAEVAKREEQLQRMGEKLTAAERAVTERAHELDKLGRLYDDATFSSSSRQIELVARESELERLSDDVNTLKRERKNVEQQRQDLEGELRALREAAAAEKALSAEQGAAVERLRETLAERDASLAASEQELARMRQALKTDAEELDRLNTGLSEIEKQKLALEVEHSRMSAQLSKLLANPPVEEVEQSIATLTADRDRLEGRLKALMRENRKLKDQVTAHGRIISEDWSDERKAGALLREQMNDLAAEVIRLTAALDGPDSPIDRALASQPANDTGASVTSLAERVRALQQKAATAG